MSEHVRYKRLRSEYITDIIFNSIVYFARRQQNKNTYTIYSKSYTHKTVHTSKKIFKKHLNINHMEHNECR